MKQIKEEELREVIDRMESALNDFRVDTRITCMQCASKLQSMLDDKAETDEPKTYIEPTDEQLIKQLTDAGFTPSEDYKEFFYGDIELEHSKSTTEVVIWGGETVNRRCVIKPCKDLASAVKLALTLLEVVK